MNVIGIDPGLDGAVVVLNVEGNVARCLAQFLTKDLCKDGYVPEIMDGVISSACMTWAPELAVLERTSARPGEGVSSSYKFGVGWGLWRGILAGRLRCIEPPPQTWQRIVLRDIPGEGKGRAINRAAQVHGLELMPGRRRKAHDGLADAACLALYGAVP